MQGLALSAQVNVYLRLISSVETGSTLDIVRCSLMRDEQRHRERNTPMKIRPTKPEHISALQNIVQANDMFPPEMLPDMLSGFLSEEDCEDRWLTCEQDGRAIGFCYTVPEELADGTWNMLAIAVLPEKQGIGAGKAIVRQLENDLRSSGQRVLIADTSGTKDFANTRAFYRAIGYTEEARIRDFWAQGDDKVVFWKAL